MTPDPNNLRELLERATVQVKKLRAENKALRGAREEPLAIIGMGCRFPGGADSPDAYWRLLRDGVDAVREIPPERWPSGPEAAELPAVRWAGLLDNVDAFDAEFHGISPREAASLDPQQRLLLEVSWEALEDANLPTRQLQGASVGVFVGLSSLDYQHHVVTRPPEELDGYSATGNMASVAAGRISYTLGLQGPCAAVDTACSSSLVAVHLAAQSLRNGESDVALAGGVNLLLSHTWMVAAGRTQSLSPDGRCRTFDAGANGFVRGEGCGVVVLKRLSDAVRDGDRIWALLRGSAINHDGRSSGLTVPNVLSQQALLRKALENARVKPEQVGYVEAHGTGTSIGDPIELEALKAVLGGPRESGAPCAIGSVKTNFGHLEAAAGIAGLIKVVLSFKHEAIPRHLHFRTLNPRISLEGTPFMVPSEGLPWKAGSAPRVAGVSSFGISGTNAHVLLEEAPAEPPRASVAWEEQKGLLLPLSARSPEALRSLALSYAHRLESGSFEGGPLEIAHTASTRRSHLSHRAAFAGRNAQEWVASLRSFAESTAALQARASPPRIAFVFPGQGSQWLGMGRELYSSEPVFRDALDSFDSALRLVSGWSVLDELRADSSSSRLLTDVDVIQPCIVAVQLALASLWRSWGVLPEVVIGQSMGEVSAAAFCGALSLQDAARVIFARSSLARRTRGQGAMATVELPPDKLSALLDSRLGIAAINGPSSTLVSGEASAVQALVEKLSASGVFCRAVKVDYASHSPQMEPLRQPLLEALRGVSGQPARVAMRSTVTNAWVQGPELGPDYWYANLRQPVQLFPAVCSLLQEDSIDVLVEVSPHPVVAPSLEQAVAHCQVDARVVTSLRREQPERLTLLTSLASLYSLGLNPDFDKLLPGPLRPVSLPSYPWQRRRYWLSPSRSGAQGSRSDDHLPPGRRVRSPALQGVLFESRLRPDSLPCFESHRFEGGVLAPATWMLSLALAAARDCLGDGAVTLREVTIPRPLFITDGEEREVQLVLAPDATKPSRFELFAASGGSGAESGWELCSEGSFDLGPVPASEGARLDVAAQRQRLAQVTDAELPAQVDAPGEDRWTTSLHAGPGEVLCGIRAARPGDRLDRFRLSPDALNEAISALLRGLGIEKNTYAPVALGTVRFLASPRGAAWIHGTVERREQSGRAMLSARLSVHDEAGEPLALLADMTFAPASLEAQLRKSVGLLRSARYELAWQQLETSSRSRKPSPASWLVFVDRSGVSEALARLLEAEGHRCVRVEHGSADPRTLDFAPLLASPGGSPPVGGAIYGWALDASVDAAEAPFASGDLDASAGALRLVQALAAVPEARLWIPTRGAWAVVDGDRMGSPSAAALWGFARVVASEHPELAPRMLDLDPRASVEDSARAMLRAMSGEGTEDQLALRGERAFGLRLRKARTASSTAAASLSPDATYLITGGWGRLGLAVAGWMVQHGARHLVLMGRSQPSEEAARTLRELEARGVRVHLARADVGSAASLREALDTVSRELPPLRGIIHASGQPDETLIRQQTWADFERVFASKAAGAWNLHHLTRDLPLDFFVLFSSVAGTLGFGGMGSYAAANAYLDALAGYRRQRGLPALSIGWGLWDHGLGEDRAKRSDRLGLRAFPVDEGLQALGALLGETASQAIVASMDWGRYVAQRGGDTPPLLTELVSAPAREQARKGRVDELRQRLSGLSGEDRERAVRDYVNGMVAQVLGYPPHHPLDAKRGLFDLGFDSLMAMDFRRRLSADLERPFPATLAFDHPSIQALTAHLLATVFSAGDTARAAAPSVPARVAVPTRRQQDTEHEPIAIVGMGCRFPGGASGTEAYWELLRGGVDTTREAPASRWDVERFFDPDPTAPGKLYVRRGAFLDDIESFDPGFFGIAPREAARMDPQQRLLLEVVWEALEDAGQPTEELVDSQTGVFISGAPSQYLQRFSAEPREFDAYALTGNIPCTLSGRVSYVLGLRGPNLYVDTGCSASLVTIHLACQSLRQRECDLALAGGVNVIMSTDMMVGLCKTGALAPDGRCKTFDASADGFARGEGVGVVVLKRLSDAVANGDRIIALVRGSAVNHDGRSGGLTVPSGPAQQQLIRKALETARVAPGDVGYVEAHGTGTELGDPIEVGALAAVYGRAASRTSPCVLGAVKSNLGHLEAAAGVAGFIKAALALHHGQIPPNLHFSRPNPKLPMEDEPFTFPTALTPWPTDGRRFAAVSSFGLGGTNAHIVLEQAPTSEEAAPRAAVDRPVHVLALSARTEEALAAQARRLSEYLETHPESRLADVCYSANRGRTRFSHRLALVGASMEELRRGLDAAATGSRGAAWGVVDGDRRPKVAFLFTGQGSQYAGMGRELYETQPVFREAIDRCAARLDGKLSAPLTSLLFEGEGAIDQTGNAQPALFALEYALSELWRSWGIVPDAVVGHSVGELAAACVAGVLSLEDGLTLIAERARLMQALPSGGAMVALRADVEHVRAAVEPHAHAVSIAAINGPDRVVISGERTAVSAIAAAFTAEGVEAKELRVSHAFHSPAMEPALEPFQRVAEAVTCSPARIPWPTNLTGKVEPRVDATYWTRQIREPVRFGDAVAALTELGCELLIEVGPHPTLLGLAAESLPEGRFTSLPSLRRGQQDSRVIAESVARLHVAGAPLDWRAFDAPFARRLVSLPTYPFQRQRLWVDFTGTELEGWYHAVEWREAPRPVAAPSFPQPGHWVLFADAGGVARALARQLAERGESCTLVRPRDATGGTDAVLAEPRAPGETVPPRDGAMGDTRVALVDPLSPEEMDGLLARERQAAGRPLRGIVHLWSLDAAPSTALTGELLARAQELGCGSTLHGVQALARGSAGEGCRLWLVTREALDAGGRPALSVAQAPLWGLAGVIAAEHPESWGGAIDLDGAPEDTLAARLLAELAAPDGEDRIAWREGRRLVSRLVRSAPQRRQPLVVRPDATYLVTGGLGALGLASARWLVERGARHVVLVGRSANAEATASLQELERAGATVRTLRADISDRAQVDALLASIAESGPALRGILHAAGVVEDGMLTGQRWDAFARVLAPKVLGTWNLHAATRDLDFFIQFSSASSLLGTLGQGNYAAGNAFLDAMAHHRRARGAPALSIHWGPWEVGMLARVDERIRRRTLGRGWTAMSVAQGLRALDAVAADGRAELAVLPIDWSALREEGTRVPPLVRELVLPPGGEPAPSARAEARRTVRELLEAAAGLERLSLLEAHVQRDVRDVLGLDTGEAPGASLDPRARFSELGMDSLMAVELKNRLQRELGLHLSPTAIFNHPSVSALTSHLVELLSSSGLFPSTPAPASAPVPAAPPVEATEEAPADELSEEAMIALIAQKYESRR
jgi:acyl transferase domain-containing protein/acyl carrier protein